MFFSRNKKNNVYTCKPPIYYIKVGVKGIKIIQVSFRDAVADSICIIYIWLLDLHTKFGNADVIYAC